ncbi:hypothetical protein BDR03DRAFT_957955 [Suillus americanus]|nr:hypothetical protein BDR03DRAFT_957955 [Suillus americanus]
MCIFSLQSCCSILLWFLIPVFTGYSCHFAADLALPGSQVHHFTKPISRLNVPCFARSATAFKWSVLNIMSMGSGAVSNS